MDNQVYLLDKDYNLECLCLPLDSVEFGELKEKIESNDSTLGVRVWGKTILVDYEYYYYCHRFNIPFRLVNIPLRSYEEATAWVCNNQLLRKALPKEMRKYLIGKRSFAEQKINLLQFFKLDNCTDLQSAFISEYAENNTSKTIVRERIAKEYNIGIATVKKYEDYSKALDSMRCDICLGFVNEHLAGRLRMSIENIENLSSLSFEEMCNECRRWLSKSINIKLRGKRERVSVSLQKTDTVPAVSIKTMPAYDPDAEIASLALTIPSWQSSIDRVKNAVNIQETSSEARCRLIDALIELNTTVYRMIHFMKARSSDERI